MTNKLSKLTNHQITNFIDEHIVWAKESELNFYSDLKGFLSRNNFLTYKQRLSLEKILLKVFSRIDRSHHFYNYRKNIYRRLV